MSAPVEEAGNGLAWARQLAVVEDLIRTIASLVPRLLHRKTGREPGRFHHVPRDVRAWFCAWF